MKWCQQHCKKDILTAIFRLPKGGESQVQPISTTHCHQNLAFIIPCSLINLSTIHLSKLEYIECDKDQGFLVSAIQGYSLPWYTNVSLFGCNTRVITVGTINLEYCKPHPNPWLLFSLNLPQFNVQFLLFPINTSKFDDFFVS